MNELITLLIILVAIISFLNKIFGQKRQSQTSQRQPTPGQRPQEWLPPWFEPEEVEIEIPGREEQGQVGPKPIEAPLPAPAIEKKKIPPEKTLVTVKPEVKPLKSFNIELASRDDLKQGIVLAEILGPCRARKRQRRI